MVCMHWFCSHIDIVDSTDFRLQHTQKCCWKSDQFKLINGHQRDEFISLNQFVIDVELSDLYNIMTEVVLPAAYRGVISG